TVDPDGRVIVGVLRFHPFRGEDPVPGEFLRIGGDGVATTVVAGVEWVNGAGFPRTAARSMAATTGEGSFLRPSAATTDRTDRRAQWPRPPAARRTAWPSTRTVGCGSRSGQEVQSAASGLTTA